jgi:hypothetical protein
MEAAEAAFEAAAAAEAAFEAVEAAASEPTAVAAAVPSNPTRTKLTARCSVPAARRDGDGLTGRSRSAAASQWIVLASPPAQAVPFHAAFAGTLQVVPVQAVRWKAPVDLRSLLAARQLRYALQLKECASAEIAAAKAKLYAKRDVRRCVDKLIATVSRPAAHVRAPQGPAPPVAMGGRARA